MKTLFLALLLSCMSAQAFAQTTAAIDPPAPPPQRWSLGVGGVATASPYAGEGMRFTPIPLINYEGDRLFLRTTKAGVHLYKRPNLEISALVSLRLDGFDIKDLGGSELRKNGLNPDQLDDRDNGLDAGLSAKWLGSTGELELELLSDVTSASEGQAVSLQYGYPMQWGKTRITPMLGATWLSSDMANYYYGTLSKEVRRGATDYRPGSAVVPRIGLSVVRPFGKQWAMFGSIQHSRLPSKVQDSPLIDQDKSSSTSVMLGLSRRF